MVYLETFTEGSHGSLGNAYSKAKDFLNEKEASGIVVNSWQILQPEAHMSLAKRCVLIYEVKSTRRVK